MQNDLVEDLILALTEYRNKSEEEREARQKYLGYDWQCTGYHFLEAKNLARIELETKLNDYIDNRIDEKIKLLALNKIDLNNIKT